MFCVCACVSLYSLTRGGNAWACASAVTVRVNAGACDDLFLCFLISTSAVVHLLSFLFFPIGKSDDLGSPRLSSRDLRRVHDERHEDVEGRLAEPC